MRLQFFAPGVQNAATYLLEGAVGRQMDLEKEHVLGEKLLSDLNAFILNIGLFLEMVRFKWSQGAIDMKQNLWSRMKSGPTGRGKKREAGRVIDVDLILCKWCYEMFSLHISFNLMEIRVLKWTSRLWNICMLFDSILGVQFFPTLFGIPATRLLHGQNWSHGSTYTSPRNDIFGGASIGFWTTWERGFAFGLIISVSLF